MNETQDRDGWLRSSMLGVKASILNAQGRFEQGLATLEQRASEGIADPSALSGEPIRIAKVLHELGRSQDAVHALESGLNCALGNAVPTALSLLAFYAQTAV